MTGFCDRREGGKLAAEFNFHLQSSLGVHRHRRAVYGDGGCLSVLYVDTCFPRESMMHVVRPE